MARHRVPCGLAVLLALALGAGATRAADPAAASRHWAFQPGQRPSLPGVHDRSWVRTPVDAFVRARLEAKGLTPNAAADPGVLLRRVYLDLIGLPPTPEEQRAFLTDPAPDAYEKVVEALLARPEYGERWARHWLDVVRYAESNGYERDGAKPSAWRYRDYVIDAFNADKPYDRFLTEQLAGDELEDANAETTIAATFLRLGTWDDEPAEPKRDHYDQLDDVLGTTATAFLGITLRCARCHDHKFEPFSQADYYRMLAVFEPLKRPQQDRTDLDRPAGTAAELRAYREATAPTDAALAAAQKQLADLQKRNSTALARTLKYLSPVAQGLLDATTAAGEGRRRQLVEEIAALNARRPKEPPHAYVWYEEGPKAPPTHVLHRGDPEQPRREVQPGVPAVLTQARRASEGPSSTEPEQPRPLAQSTGRRLWLAHWLTRPDNPLVARVLVNRVWQHHFGRGLVASANDFGVSGDPPTHPELLDWLASEFVAGGWSIKKLHRLIVLSNTYRESAALQPEAARVDPSGALLWRWRQQRLEAEAVRDAMLAVSGRLNAQMRGPSVYPPLPRAVLEGQSRPGDGWGRSDERQAARRSIYIFAKRSLAVPELDVLDAPDTTSSCEQRLVSTIAPQALTFLNGNFSNEQARHFAARLQREAGAEAGAQVRRAFALALCRPPRPDEVRACLAFLATQQHQIEAEARQGYHDTADAARRALEALCLVLLNTNEFVYVD